MLDRGNSSVAEPLLECLRRRLGQPSLRYRRPPRPLAGGKFSEVYALELDPQPEDWVGAVVCRLLRSPDQTRLEAAMSIAATADGLSAPRLLLWEPEPPELGGGYLVMERVPGRTYLRGVEPWRFVLDLPKLLSSWPSQFAKVISALARVDVDESAATLEGHGVPEDLARPGRHLRTVSSLLADEPTLAVVVDWLHDNEPSPPERLALVHGDLWPANVFVDGGSIRLIDWTRAGIDDPALDVGFAKIGFALMPEPFPPPPPISQFVHLIGASIARRISTRCDQLVGGSERVRYYEALRCAVELADVTTGRQAGDRSGWEHGVPALVRHLEGITGQPIAFR